MHLEWLSNLTLILRADEKRILIYYALKVMLSIFSCSSFEVSDTRIILKIDKQFHLALRFLDSSRKKAHTLRYELGK